MPLNQAWLIPLLLFGLDLILLAIYLDLSDQSAANHKDNPWPRRRKRKR